MTVERHDIRTLLATPQWVYDLHEEWKRSNPGYQAWLAFVDDAQRAPMPSCSPAPYRYTERDA